MSDSDLYGAYQAAADTSFATEVWRFGDAVSAGTLVAAAVILLFAWPWRRPNATRLRIGWPLALGAGFLLAAYRLTERPQSLLVLDQDRLLALILPAVLVVEILAVFVPRLGSWLLRGVLACVVGRVLLHETSWLADPSGLGLAPPTWSTLEATLWLGGMAALLSGMWLMLAAVPRSDKLPACRWGTMPADGISSKQDAYGEAVPRSDKLPACRWGSAPADNVNSKQDACCYEAPRLMMFLLGVTALAAGGTIANFGYMTAGKLAILQGVLLLTLTAISLLGRWPMSSGLTGVATVLLFSLVVMGRFFGSLSTTQALLLLSAPVVAVVVQRFLLFLSATSFTISLLALASALAPLGMVVLPQINIRDILNPTTQTVLLGVVPLGAVSGIVGCFAVLRGRALTGDALAHAALPGVCIAYLLVRERHDFALLVGAFASGITGIGVVSALRRWTRIKEDAAIAIVLGVFFGAGIFLLSLTQRLSGGGASGLNSYLLGQTASIIWDEVVPILLLAGGTAVIVLLLYKEFKLISFDRDFAQAQGWPAQRLDLLLMGLIAVTVVVGLPAVGVVMMAALLIIPAAAARFWTERLRIMLVLAATFGAIMAVIGVLVSSHAGLPASPAIILVGAVIFLLSAAAAPRRGFIARAIVMRQFQREVEERKLLRLLLELSGTDPPTVALAEVQQRRSWSPRRLRNILRRARRFGWLDVTAAAIELTPAGTERAMAVRRGHRLWELFLNEYPELARSYASLSAESIEGELPDPLVRELLEKQAK